MYKIYSANINYKPIFIGYTTTPFYRRWSPSAKRAKFGALADSIEFEIICCVDDESEAKKIKAELVKKHDTFKKGLNCTPEGLNCYETKNEGELNFNFGKPLPPKHPFNNNHPRKGIVAHNRHPVWEKSAEVVEKRKKGWSWWNIAKFYKVSSITPLQNIMKEHDAGNL